MSADPAKRRGVLSDSEATLRQVQSVLYDIGATDPITAEKLERVVGELRQRPTGLRDVVQILLNVYAEIINVIDSLRRSRGLLEQAAMERLKSTHEKLAEVSSATEMAATGMLDGLDRALSLVDRMDGSAGTDGSDGSADGGELRGELRDELHSLINLLQFQDITAQQLGYAGSVLADTEERMLQLARIFDLRGVGIDDFDEVEDDAPRAESRTVQAERTCDPEASHFDSDSRQALADEIFTSPGV